MNKNFLIIATLAGLASTASAASTDQAIHVLPTYVVTAPREMPAEQQVNESLKEFRSEAQHLVTVPAPSVPKVQPTIQMRATKPAPLAKVVARS